MTDKLTIEQMIAKYESYLPANAAMINLLTATHQEAEEYVKKQALLREMIRDLKSLIYCIHCKHLKCADLEDGCAYPDCGHEDF